MTRGLSAGFDLGREDDSDDVKWALQTAAVQMSRGGVADAVTWIQRAAEAAEGSGNEWRALELRAHARSLLGEPANGPQSRRSSIPVEVVVEEVELDELLDEEELPTNPPPPPFGGGRAVAAQPLPAGLIPYGVSAQPQSPQPQSSPNPYFAAAPGRAMGMPPAGPALIPPGGPAFGAPAFGGPAFGAPGFGPSGPPPVPFQGGLGEPPPLPLQPGPPALQPWGQGAVQPPSSPTGFLGSTGFAPGAGAGDALLLRASYPPPSGGERSPGGHIASPIPLSAPPKAGSLAQKTRIAFPAAGRLRQPSAPSLGYASSSVPPPLPEDAFASQGARFEAGPARRPLVSAPELEVNEVDLDEVGFELGSIPSESLSQLNSDRVSFNDRLSSANVERFNAEAVIAHTGVRMSEQPPSQDLSHLFDEEEVLDDDASLDRLSDLTLDPGEFADVDPPVPAAARTGFEHTGSPVGGGMPSTPAPGFEAEGGAVPAPSAPTWLTPSAAPGYRYSSVPSGAASVAPESARAAGMGGANSAVPPSMPPASMPPASVPPASLGAASTRAPASVPPPSAAHASRMPASVPPPADVLPSVPFPPSPSSVRPNSVPPPPGSTPAPRESQRPSAGMASGPASVAPKSARAASSAPPLLHRSPPPPKPQSSRPSAESERPRSILDFAQALTGSTPPPSARGSLAPAAGESTPPTSASSLPTMSPPPAAASASPPDVAAVGSNAATLAAPPSVRSAQVDGVELGEARGFEDLPAEVQRSLAASARIEALEEGEEVAFFGAAVVTFGAVDILPAISDEAGAMAHQGEVVFTLGTLPDSIQLRVVAKLPGTRVAVWDVNTLNAAIAECPWVHDDLHQIADRFLARCGATLGVLGERLDDALRATVFSRLEVRVFGPGEVLAKAGSPVPRFFVVGGGRVEVVDATGQITQELASGDFLFPTSILSAAPAPGTARAGQQGALVLEAPRSVAHELMMSVPPLLELLAG